MPQYTCPCCGYITFTDPPGSDEICEICFWEDDLSQLKFPSETGANKISLIIAQQNYEKFGANDKRCLTHVRSPRDSDIKDPNWRKFDVSIDTLMESVKGVDYGGTYPRDLCELYYWNTPIEPIKRLPVAKMIQTSKKILNSEVDLIQGCRAMYSLLIGFPEQYEKEFLIFTVVPSETDHLPIGDERKNWDKDVLTIKDLEVKECEDFYREEVFKACKEILRRLDS